MQAIRRWMAAHPQEARDLMWENQSFIFFREVELEDPELGALGAQHVQLTPRRSLAIDRVAVDVRHAGLAGHHGSHGR